MMRCSKCSALLPKEHGFSDLCDNCSGDQPLEIIGATNAPKSEQAVLRRSDTGTVTVRPRKRREDYQPITSAQIAKPIFAELDLGISEDATYDELVKYRDSVLAEITELRSRTTEMSAGERDASAERLLVSLHKRRYLLGQRDQRLQKLIAEKRPAKIPVAKSIRSVTLDKKMISNYFAMRMFYEIAREMLPEDTFSKIEKSVMAEFTESAEVRGEGVRG